MKQSRVILGVFVAGLLSACPVAVAAQGGTDITGTIPLETSNINSSGLTASGAVITWETNGGATSQVYYDTSSHADINDYAHSTEIDLTLVSAHSVTLSGLTAGTTYHYRVKSEIPDTVFSTISDDGTFATSASGGGGGGGGGGGFGSQLIGIGLSGTSPFMDGNGRAITAGEIKTADGKVSLSVPVGVYIWNAAGAAQPFLSAQPLANPPPAPPENSLVMAIEMGPNGVTFNPAVTLTFNYKDSDLPSGAREADLYIAWWDGTQWVKLLGTVNASANTVSVQVTHFTSYALLIPAAPPVLTPTLKIAGPLTGTSFDSGDVTISINAGNINLVGDNRPNAPGEGRVVYYLDVPIPTTPGASAFSAAGTYKESESTTNGWTGLAPGIHILGVQLVQNDHTPFSPPLFATVSVTIKAAVIAPPTTTVPIPTSESPIITTPPTPDQTKPGWLIPILFFVAAAGVAVFIFWRSRRPEAKLKYTNR
ncbi:Purple acid Phosphatase, N-terminal domain [Dehalogenimonas formicexedens]|uniref:Purple acid Phosphatase, N-terminal domain n=1 Tax=Dehalogenimonas formicexedens TaxID=1839801 RepID=A0A1P8F7J2_9CHLR|nr:fibronectin type III domain-containing protein [Dehalogenimonas formicexedens]APV44456.1 Purple acid Phosphatase, N-terminal domain [Dehalogenimonas formicexedens]